MSARELAAWESYYATEPFGAERDNLHAAMTCALLANIHRGKGGKAIKPEDFMIRYQDPDLIEAQKHAATRAHFLSKVKPKKKAAGP